MRFRKKPVVIEAVQWWGSLGHGGYDSDGRYENTSIGVDEYGVEHTVTECGIRTANGFVRLNPGDWICTQVVNGKTDRWPCNPDIFAATYEPADQPSPEL